MGTWRLVVGWRGGVDFFTFPEDMLLNSLGMRTKQLQNKWGRDKAKTWPYWERSAKKCCQEQTQRKEDWQPGKRDLEKIIGLGHGEEARFAVGRRVDLGRDRSKRLKTEPSLACWSKCGRGWKVKRLERVFKSCVLPPSGARVEQLKSI